MNKFLDLEPIEARANAATPELWVTMGSREGEYYVRPDNDRFVLAAFWENPQHGFNAKANAEFIAHARTDVPALIARVRELEGAIKSAVHTLDEWHVQGGDHPYSHQGLSAELEGVL